MEDQSQLITAAPDTASNRYFQPPQESEVPDNTFGKLIQEGHALFVDFKNRAPDYVGDGLACANCHLQNDDRRQAVYQEQQKQKSPE
jgi:thiosulfate dehydrogenase